MLELQPFDLVCVAGDGRISAAIRWATSRRGNQTAVSHVSFVVTGGDLYTAELQEALVDTGRIERRTLADGYEGTGDRVAIYRPLWLTDRERMAMFSAAAATLGLRYGYVNIGLQLVDALLGKVANRPVRFARRFASNRWQECVHNVAVVWQSAGLCFGVDSGVCTPDEVFAFCRERTDLYGVVRELEPVPTRAAPEVPPVAALPELLPAS